MTERISAAARIEAQSVAEREVMRYADDHALWHKHVHNVTLDPAQVLKCIEMDRHSNTIDVSCRRTGKTAVKEMYLLKKNATTADQELGIVAPREAQSIVNLNYHLDAIRRSQILPAYINVKGARRQIADTYYQFANRSVARAYGIMAQVDGGDLTLASIEEVDDLPKDRLYGRFLLMMGSARRLGAAEGAVNKPEIRITGVFKGADTLTDLIDGGTYHLLPTVDVHLGMQMGILNRAFVEQMRDELDADEYIRQLLCKNISSRNLIWEKYIGFAKQTSLKAGLELVEPMPGEQHKKRGLVGFGYDAGGHGENPTSSKHALVVTEMIGNWLVFVFARTWPAGADDAVVKNDLKAYWRYFMPDCAMGDAYGVGMLSQLNDELYREGLTPIDRRSIGDGDSTASTWPEWAFAPMRFEGMVKHQMATTLRAAFHHRHAVIPYTEDADDKRAHEPAVADMRLLARQLSNIVAKPTKAAYPSYKMADAKRGDDLFDACCASVWALATRTGAAGPTVILTSSRPREALLQPAQVHHGHSRLLSPQAGTA